MHTFKCILYVLLILLSGGIVVLPYLPGSVAGHIYWLSFLAWPLLFVDLLLWIQIRKQLGWRYAFAVATLLQILWLWNYIPSFQEDHEDESTLTIISWNVGNFGTISQNTIVLPNAVEAMLAHHPDIICIQERPHTNVLQWDSIKLRLGIYPYAMKNTREDEVLNLAIFSKYPLENLKEYYFPDTHNKIMSVDVRPGDKKIRLFNVHLQTTGISGGKLSENFLSDVERHTVMRNQQADSLHKAISESSSPVFVCGDFNDIRTSYTYRVVSDGMKDVHHEAGTGWGNSYGYFKIDYMLCSKDILPVSYQLVDSEWSDHKMQVGKITLNKE